jgi:hypothetical protein
MLLEPQLHLEDLNFTLFYFLLGGWGAGPPTKENELFGLGYLSYSMVVVMLIFVWLALWVVTDK